MIAVSSEKSLCKNKKMDPISEYNGDTMRSLGHGSGTVQCPISCPCLSLSQVPVANLEATPEKGEKASRNKKKLDPVTRDGSTLTRIHGHLQAPPPSPCHNLEIPMKSETSTSMTVSTSMTTSCMKSSDAKISDSCTSVSRVSSGSTRSDSLDSYTTASIKRQSDSCWKAIQTVNSKEPPLGLYHFKLLKRLGYGDIGSVYLVELNDASTYVAMKVIDKTSLVSRNKLSVHKLKREILGLLDHPFLPTLYSHFEIDQFYCLVMEFCSGGNLCSLRQKQPNKYFSEQAAPDLKPENVLV